MDWSEIFRFSMNPLELVVRGSLIYGILFVAFRVILHRDVGAIGIADVLFIVIVADASQNAMAGQYRSVSDGLVLIATLVFWNVAIDYAAYRFPRLRQVLEPPPLPLIENGRILHRNLRREFMSVEALMSKLREHGVEKVARVRRATMESDGTVTVLTMDGEPNKAPPRGGSIAGI